MALDFSSSNDAFRILCFHCFLVSDLITVLLHLLLFLSQFANLLVRLANLVYVETNKHTNPWTLTFLFFPNIYYLSHFFAVSLCPPMKPVFLTEDFVHWDFNLFTILPVCLSNFLAVTLKIQSQYLSVFLVVFFLVLLVVLVLPLRLQKCWDPGKERPAQPPSHKGRDWAPSPFASLWYFFPLFAAYCFKYRARLLQQCKEILKHMI